MPRHQQHLGCAIGLKATIDRTLENSECREANDGGKELVKLNWGGYLGKLWGIRRGGDRRSWGGGFSWGKLGFWDLGIRVLKWEGMI